MGEKELEWLHLQVMRLVLCHNSTEHSATCWAIITMVKRYKEAGLEKGDGCMTSGGIQPCQTNLYSTHHSQDPLLGCRRTFPSPFVLVISEHS